MMVQRFRNAKEDSTRQGFGSRSAYQQAGGDEEIQLAHLGPSTSCAEAEELSQEVQNGASVEIKRLDLILEEEEDFPISFPEEDEIDLSSYEFSPLDAFPDAFPGGTTTTNSRLTAGDEFTPFWDT